MLKSVRGDVMLTCAIREEKQLLQLQSRTWKVVECRSDGNVHGDQMNVDRTMVTAGIEMMDDAGSRRLMVSMTVMVETCTGKEE